MRCSCRTCGTYMVQEEYGLQSGCRCPDCGAMCRDCMGSAQEPLKKDELAAYFALGLFAAGGEQSESLEQETERENETGDWRKYL